LPGSRDELDYVIYKTGNFAHIPTERHILYLFNDAIPSHDAARRYLAEVIAFREARTPGK